MELELNYGLLFLMGLPATLLFTAPLGIAVNRHFDLAKAMTLGVPAAALSSAGNAWAMAVAGFPISVFVITGVSLFLLPSVSLAAAIPMASALRKQR